MSFSDEFLHQYLNYLFISKKNKFLPEKITRAVQNANFEIINKLSLDEINGLSNLYMGSGRPLIFDTLDAFNSLNVLSKFIELGANVNAIDTGFPSRSVLYHAVKYGSHINLIKKLVESGANVNFTSSNIEDDFPRSTIGTALFYRKYEVVEYLKSNKAKFIPNEESNILDYLSQNK
jgi:hypothetical protein